MQFKQAFPDMLRDYEKACRAGEVRLGKMHVYDRGGLNGGPRWVINFPTKGHWRERSRLADIEAGLRDLVARCGDCAFARLQCHRWIVARRVELG